MLICGICGGRYYLKRARNYAYYCCYSRTKQVSSMIKSQKCKNKYWRASELESIINKQVRELLMSPQMAKEIAEAKRPKQKVIDNDNDAIEKRIREIDKQISKLMELYQLDNIPPEILGENINKLYNEKTALQKTLVKTEEPESVSFEFVEILIKDAAQIWDFADDAQKRRILQGLINRIVLTGDKVDIEWNF